MPYTPPPTAVSAGDLEDSYIALFKAKDSRAARLFEFAELLYNAGKLTADDVAGFINDVLCFSSEWIAKLATDFESFFSTPFVASVLNSAAITTSNAVSIFDNANLSAARAYSILAHANLLADKTQSILYNMTFVTKLVDILTYGAGDLTVSANTSISGVNRYGTLTVNSGVTLTITGQPSALIVKTLNNSGTIAKSATGGAGGTAGVSGAGPGGAGGGGLVIFADSFGNSGVISADGAAGAAGATVAASAAGGAGGSGVFFTVGADAAGSGGNGGNYSGTSYNPGGVNGAGGGGVGSSTYKGGAGDGSSYTGFADYASLATRIRQSVIDWVIVNVFVKSPTSTQAIPNAYGSGGGGGGALDTSCAGGGGGGGGGEVLALCVSLNNTGTVRANAGNGGNGGTEGSYDACGGGGGGGIVYALYKTLVASGTLSAAYGTHGATADYHGTNGTAGTATAQAV
jgi:hypothetical protein